MRITVARWISVLLHPLVMLLLSMFFVLSQVTSRPTALHWLFFSVFFVILFSLGVAIGVRRQVFSNYDVSDRLQRGPLYILAGVIGGIFTLGLLLLHAPKYLFVMAGVLFVLVSLLSLANSRIKASGHTACVVVFSVSMIIFYGQIYALLLLLIPLIIWSRVTLGRHSLGETFAGGGLGALTMFGLLLFTKALT